MDADVQRAVALSYRDFLSELLTEPLTVSELARWWRISRRKMRTVLANMEKAERVAGRWRVPLVSMPPAYLRDHGLLPGPS